MKKLALILLPLLTACASKSAHEGIGEGFDALCYAPEYANGFALYTNGEQVMLETYRPDTMRVVIPQGGFERMACMSSTYVGLLDAAGSTERIVAVSGKRFLCNKAVAERVAEVGYEGAMDYESLLAAAPDIVLIYGVGGKSAIASKLEQLGLNYVYIGDFEEQDPLGRAEWMVALGALAGQDVKQRFGKIAEAYAPSEGDARVMLNAPYGGAWFLPGKDGYMTRLIEDAGGTLAVTPVAGYESTPVDMERAVVAVSSSQFWLNSGGANVAHAEFAGEKWEQTRDFFESGAARPDMVLHELQAIFQGGAPDTLRYFKRI